MNRGGTDDRSLAKHNTSTVVVTATIEGETQRQKKRLSFKDPEIEPRQSRRPLQTTSKHSSLARARDLSQEAAVGLEDLTLEDQALQVVKSVGQAFIRPFRDSVPYVQPITLAKDTTSSVKEKEFTAKENRPKSTLKYSLKADLSEKLPAPPTPPAMRCPIIEIVAEDDAKAAGVQEEDVEEKSAGATREVESSSSASKNASLDTNWPTGARHQIQLLHLQLEQQRQQTQTAMSQIQLLKDQLEAEGSARYQAQVQNQQLMSQNKGLVNQIQQLFQQIQDFEKQLEDSKKSSQQNPPFQESKQTTLSAPGLNPYGGYRRNSASLWSNTLGLIGRRNSATVSPTPQQEPTDTVQKQFLGDNYSRRTSITDDLAAASRFSSMTDWRLRRRGSSTLTLDLSSKGRTNNTNGFNMMENPSPSPIDRTKITPLFSSESKMGIVQSVKPRTEVNPSSASNTFKSEPSLAILDSPTTEYVAAPSLLSNRSFKPIEPATQHLPSYPIKQSRWDRDTDNQSKLAKSLETLRLFDS